MAKSVGTRITKREYEALGGMANSNVYRKMVSGRWQYYKVNLKSNPGVPVGKFIPARLNPDGSVSFLLKGKPPRKARNVAYGHTIGTGEARQFFPHRSSADYDPTYLKGPEGVRARAKKKAKAKKATKKTAKKKTAKRKR